MPPLAAHNIPFFVLAAGSFSVGLGFLFSFPDSLVLWVKGDRVPHSFLPVFGSGV